MMLRSTLLLASRYLVSTRTRPTLTRSFALKGPNYCVDDPSSLKYWKSSGKQSFSEAAPILRKCQIVSLSDAKDPANDGLHHGTLPDGAELVAIGATLDDFDLPHLLKMEPNVLFVSHPLSRGPLQELLKELPSIEWVHTRSAGIDFVTSKGLAESNVYVTNAKGQFSSTLAEYTMMACSYFAKARIILYLHDVFCFLVFLTKTLFLFFVNISTNRISHVSCLKRNPKHGPSTMSWNCGGRHWAWWDMVTLVEHVPNSHMCMGCELWPFAGIPCWPWVIHFVI